MASPIAETQLVSGDIFFQSGMYKKKLNVKTASNISYTQDVIDLTKYTEGETWEQVSLIYSIVEIDIRQSENIKSFNVKPIYLTDNRNTFKFVAEINGKDVNNRIAVSWYAREEIIDIQGEKFSTKESPNQNQSASFNLQYQAKSVLSVTSDNGQVGKYELGNGQSSIQVELKNGTVYATYSKNYKYEELGKPGSYNPATTKKISTTLWYDNRLGNMPFSGTLSLTTNAEKRQAWQIGAERIYQDERTSYVNPGTEYEHREDRDVETKVVVTQCVLKSTDSGAPYTKHYRVFAKDYRRTILRDCIWTGNVYAQTYLYLVNISYIKADNSPQKASTAEEEGIWINISSEELIQSDTLYPPKLNSFILDTTLDNDYFRYYVTKVVPIYRDSFNPYYTHYRIYGIKQMRVFMHPTKE